MDIHKKYTYQFEMLPSIPFYSLVNLNHLVFEITSCCNLDCVYCGYGPIYNMRTHNERSNMKFAVVQRMIDYLVDIWTKYENDYDLRETTIGFYGGEPLLNFNLIESTVSYIESLQLKKRVFGYTMTTNGILLDKHMDFLAEKEFNVVISLDGDKEANSYRVDKNNRNSFDIVFQNAKMLQDKYPGYFSKHVIFNSVLTNRGSLVEIKDFISKKFNKSPMISEVNNFGILESQKTKFEEIFRSVRNEWKNASGKNELLKNDFRQNPINKISYTILKYFSGNSFGSYNSLLFKNEGTSFPTGTCFPFDKKMFINVKGDIFPCERINQKYSLGHVSEHEVELDLQFIADKYTKYYKKVWNLCKTCHAQPICEHCLFYIDNLDGKPVCPNYLNKSEYERLINSHLHYLSENPEMYQTIMKEMY